MKLLLVDDERLSRSLMADGLRMHGFFVEEARSADQALAKYESGKFSFVVTDIIMNGPDGFELATKISEIDASTGSRPKLVALTGSVTDHKDTQRYAEIFDLVLSKPITVDQVALSLLRLPSSTGQTSRSA